MYQPFIISLHQIINAIGYESPPEVYQFFRNISDERAQFTIHNIIESNLLYLMISLISTDTPEILLIHTLFIISSLLYATKDLTQELLENNFIDLLTPIYTYPSFQVQEKIANIFATLMDEETCLPEYIPIYHEAFLQQAIQWGEYHNSKKCRKYCLTFIYLLIESTELESISSLYMIFNYLIGLVKPGNGKITQLACWSLRCLISKNEIETELSSIIQVVFSVLYGKMAYPALRLLGKSLKIYIEPQVDVCQLINWPLIMNLVLHDDPLASFSASKVINRFINWGQPFIEGALQSGLLDITLMVYQREVYSSRRQVSLALKSILLLGTSEHISILIHHQCFPEFVNFIGKLDDCDLGEGLNSILLAIGKLSLPEIAVLFVNNNVAEYLSRMTENIENVSSEIAANILILLGFVKTE